MRTTIIMIAGLAALCLTAHAADEEGFTELFNGKDLSGWKLNETPESFKVADGVLIANGPRCHLFYTGDVNGGKFTDFEAKLKVLIKPKSNAGFYFHTAFQDEGWPKKGFEAQLCATSYEKDAKKTGSLYGVVNVMDTAPHADDEWFDYYIKVQGKKVTIKVNGKTTVEYTEPEKVEKAKGGFDRRIDSGTFAIQCHDPVSEVHFKSIKVKPL
ncbi:MAG: DUF1080 domain-containing protein [Verrucomicrobiota bacterium]